MNDDLNDGMIKFKEDILKEIRTAKSGKHIVTKSLVFWNNKNHKPKRTPTYLTIKVKRYTIKSYYGDGIVYISRCETIGELFDFYVKYIYNEVMQK